MKKLATILIIIATALFSTAVLSQTKDGLITQYIKSSPGDFEEVFAELQDVIINEGLVVDFVGNVDDMLERTSQAAQSVTPNGQKSPYLHAKTLQFCSARLTHLAVSADAQNIAICPYIFFIYETRSNPGKISVGFRPPIFGASKRSRKIRGEVVEFLRSIVDKTIDG